jgi:hypothetical protein
VHTVFLSVTASLLTVICRYETAVLNMAFLWEWQAKCGYVQCDCLVTESLQLRSTGLLNLKLFKVCLVLYTGAAKCAEWLFYLCHQCQTRALASLCLCMCSCSCILEMSCKCNQTFADDAGNFVVLIYLLTSDMVFKNSFLFPSSFVNMCLPGV